MAEVFVVVHQESALYDTFVLRGNIDMHAEAEFAAIPATVTRSKVLFDFSEVGRINSSGIAQLLRCFKKITDVNKAEIVLIGLSTIHTMLFKTTGVFLLAKAETAGP